MKISIFILSMSPRICRLGSIELFDRNALMLCASKVASTTGDLRTVFDVCRSVENSRHSKTNWTLNLYLLVSRWSSRLNHQWKRTLVLLKWCKSSRLIIKIQILRITFKRKVYQHSKNYFFVRWSFVYARVKNVFVRVQKFVENEFDFDLTWRTSCWKCFSCWWFFTISVKNINFHLQTFTNSKVWLTRWKLMVSSK